MEFQLNHEHDDELDHRDATRKLSTKEQLELYNQHAAQPP
jgi:hypothetical protein